VPRGAEGVTMARMTPVVRRYMIRITIAMTVYIAGLFAANYLIDNELVSGPLAWAAALVPGVAIASVFYVVGLLILEQKDEFIRMLLIRQSLIANAFAMSIVVVWGFLEGFALVGHVAGYGIVVLWAIGMLIGAVSNRLTHGSWGQCW
jgi:hypothetical protein